MTPQCLCAEALLKLLDEVVTLTKKMSGMRDTGKEGRRVRHVSERASRPGQSPPVLLHHMRPGCNWFSSDVRTVEIAGVLAHHVGGSRTRALQHRDRFTSVVVKRTRNDGPHKGGGALRRKTTTTTQNTAGRKSQTSKWGGGEFDPFVTTVYVEDHLQTTVHHTDNDTATVKYTGLDTMIDALGFAVSSHTMTISVPEKRLKRYRDCCSSNGPRAGGKGRRGTCLA